MALSERQEREKIEIIGAYNHIQIITSTIIERDGEVISRTSERRTIKPIDDLTNEEELIQQIASAIWTEEVVEAYKEFMSNQ